MRAGGAGQDDADVPAAKPSAQTSRRHLGISPCCGPFVKRPDRLTAVVRFFDAPRLQQWFGKELKGALQDIFHDADVLPPVVGVFPSEPHHHNVTVARRALEHRDDVSCGVRAIDRGHEEDARQTAALYPGGVSSTAISNEPRPMRSGPFRYNTSITFSPRMPVA